MPAPVLGAVLSIVPNILGMVGDYFKGKRDLKQAQLEAEIAHQHMVTQTKMRLAEAREIGEIDWAKEMAEASQTSWKDEYWTLVISVPAIMAFIPGLVGYVEAGFAALSQTPEWYQLTLLVAVGASFGVRIWATAKKKII